MSLQRVIFKHSVFFSRHTWEQKSFLPISYIHDKLNFFSTSPKKSVKIGCQIYFVEAKVICIRCLKQSNILLQEKFRREFAVRLPCLRCLKDTTPKPPNYQTNACTNGRTEVSQVPMHTKNGGRNYGAAARSPRSTNTKEIIHIEVHNKVQ